MKDIEETIYILRIKISHHKKSKKYIDHILKKFEMKVSKTVGTPIAKRANMSKSDCLAENQSKLNVLCV